MWTHKHCYSEGIQTSHEIKKIAALELAQSLKFGRTIAIVGSGMSTAYGHLNWDELGKFMVLNTLDRARAYIELNQDNNRFKANCSRVNIMVDEIIEIAEIEIVATDTKLLGQYGYARLKNFKFDADTVILQLCRHTSELIKDPSLEYNHDNELDDIVRKIFSGSSIERFKARLRCICYQSYIQFDSIVRGYQCQKKFDEKLEIENSQNLILDTDRVDDIKAILSEILSGHKNIFESAENSDLVKLLSDKIKSHNDNIQPASNLELDEEIFNDLYTIHDNKSEQYIGFALRAFIKLYCYDKAIKKRNASNYNNLTAHSPYSILINKMKLSRFVTLNYDEEIESTFKTFGYQEKSSGLMYSNHISQYTDGYGGVLVSKAPTIHSVGDLLVFSSTSSDCSATVFHLHGASSIAQNSSLLLSEDDYQNQYLKGFERRIVFDEGLRTLFGGNDILFLGIGMSEEDLLRPLRQYLAERPKFPRQARTLVALKEYSYKESDKTLKQSQCKANRETLAMKFKYDVRIIGYHIKLKPYAGNSNEVKNLNEKKAIDTKRYEFAMCCYYINKTQHNKIRLEKQCAYLEKINKDSQEWWEAWQCRPKPRLAKWKTDSNNTTARYSLITLKDISEPELYFSPIIKKIESNQVQDNNKRRILRFSAPRGYGKGYFITMLRKDPSHGQLFGNQKYAASFFADAYFSTEFNSVISAFAIFLLQTLQQLFIKSKNNNKKYTTLKNYLEGGNPFNQDLYRQVFPNQNDGVIGKLNIIRELFKKLNAYLVAVDSRILICLSGIDRICDSRGYGFNALHRSFFKLLAANKLLEDIQYDLIVVAGEPKAPIHFLSESLYDIDDDKYDRRSQLHLSPWLRLPHSNSQLNLQHRTNKNFEISASEKIIIDFRYRSVFFDFIMNHAISKVKKFDTENTTHLCEEMYHNISYVLSCEITAIHDTIGILLDIYWKIEKEKFPGLRNIQTVLKHLALFSYPVEASVIQVCPDIVMTFDHLDEKFGLKSTLKWLNENCLILSFSETVKGSGDRYALHRMVRDFLADRMDYAIYERDEHSFFDVSIYSEQPRDLPSPKFKDYQAIQKILTTLNKITTDSLRYVEPTKIKNKDQDLPGFIAEFITDATKLSEVRQTLIDQVNMLRASVHLMNTAFSVGVISRMNDFEFVDLYEANSQRPTPFECYCDTANSIINNAVRIDTALEYFSEQDMIIDGEQCDKRILRVFYPTQIAWLYNEQAITRFVQGRLFECIPLYDLAIKTLSENDWSVNWSSSNQENYEYPENSSLRRVLLNKAIALIEFGHIDEARKILKDLNQRGEIPENKNSLTVILAGAYLGLCSHLRGSYDEARTKYEHALEKLKQRFSCERSKALIYKYLGDLDRTEKKLKDSRRSLELAANFAESVHQRDVYYQIKLSLAKLNIREEKYTEAFTILKESEIYARKLGIPKLLVDCWMVRGHINLLQNQTTIAGEYLSHAIATSSRNGMVLFKVASLHMYCAMLDKRNTEEARRYANCIRHAAKIRSERMGYPFKTEFNGESLDSKFQPQKT